MEILALSLLLSAWPATAHFTKCLTERFLSFEVAETLRLPSFDEVLVYQFPVCLCGQFYIVVSLKLDLSFKYPEVCLSEEIFEIGMAQSLFS